MHHCQPPHARRASSRAKCSRHRPGSPLPAATASHQATRRSSRLAPALLATDNARSTWRSPKATARTRTRIAKVPIANKDRARTQAALRDFSPVDHRGHPTTSGRCGVIQHQLGADYREGTFSTTSIIQHRPRKRRGRSRSGQATWPNRVVWSRVVWSVAAELEVQACPDDIGLEIAAREELDAGRHRLADLALNTHSEDKA